MTARLKGNWATLLLPIAADDSIDFARLGEEIDLLIAARVDGIYSNGTAGEFHNQTDREYEAIQTLLATKCQTSGMPFVTGACQPDPILAREKVCLATNLNPEAIQVILPDWWPVTEPEAIDFLTMMAEAAAGVPLILYNPPHAKRVLAPEELGRLCRAVPSLAGIKLADGDAAWYEAARRHLIDVALFVPGHHLATGRKHGVAAGSFSNVACLSPRGAQIWTDSMASELEAALDLELRICRFMDEHVAPFRRDHGYSNAAVDKLLAAVGGWGPVGTRLRRPYRWISESEVPRLRDIARRDVPELFRE